MSPGINLQDIGLSYADKPLFNKLNAHFKGGCWHSILGRSGVGKSSLLQSIAGLLSETTLEGTGSADDHRPQSEWIALMAQRDALLPWLNVQENVVLGVRLRKQRTAEAQAQAQ